jgi:hypothetical protein
MTDELRAFLNEQTQEIDDMVREAIELCDGSPLRALYTTIIANKFLGEDNQRLREENAQLSSQTSKGFTRVARKR